MPAASGGARHSARPPAFGEGVSVAALKALVIGMGVLIVAGTVTLVVLLVQRANVATGGRGAVAAADGRAGTPAEGRAGMVAPAGPAAALALGAPEGSRVGGIAAAGGAVAIWVVRPDGDRVVLVDGATGRQTGEIRLRE
jgi:hypothetical protein